MKKTILIVMVLVILSIGMVEGYLGGELVTCGDFSCSTDWVGFTVVETNWTWDGSDLALFSDILGGGALNNLSQSITVQPSRLYNVTMNISSLKSFGQSIFLSVYLGNTKREIIRDVTAPYTIYSVNITTENTDGLFIEARIGSNRDFINVSSISVKEIITIDEYEVVAMVNKNGVPIKEYETSIEPNKVNWVIRMIEKIFRVLK